MAKDENPTCRAYAVLGVITVGAYIGYRIVEFFREPSAIRQIVDCLGALVIGIGVITLFVLCVSVYGRIFAGPQQVPLRGGKNYAIRCYAIEMEKLRYESIPADLPKKPAQGPHHPMLANLVITNYGLWVSKKPKEYLEERVAAENPEEDDGPIKGIKDAIIQLSQSKLYYLTYRRKDNQEFERCPSNSAGFTDAIPNPQTGEQLRIVLVFTHVIEKDNLQKAIQLERPVKLNLTLLDESGNDDLFATAGFYRIVYDKIKAMEEENDDSWVYRSRPIYW